MTGMTTRSSYKKLALLATVWKVFYGIWKQALETVYPSMNEIFSSPFARISPVDVLWWDKVNLNPKEAVDKHIENEPQGGGVEDEGLITENESTCGWNYDEMTQLDTLRMISEALKEQKRYRLGCPLDNI